MAPRRGAARRRLELGQTSWPRPSGPRRDLARLAPDIAPQLATGPDTDPPSSRGNRRRLMESLLGFLGRLAAVTPVLLAIEDVIGPIRRPARPSRSWCAAADRAGAGGHDIPRGRAPPAAPAAPVARGARAHGPRRAIDLAAWTRTGPRAPRGVSAPSRPLASSDRSIAVGRQPFFAEGSWLPAAAATAADGRARSGGPDRARRGVSNRPSACSG